MDSTPNVEASEAAADFIEGLLDAGDIPGDIDYGVRQGRPFVDLPGPDTAALVGKDGEGITALQHLTRLAIRRRVSSDAAPVLVDVDGFRARQREQLFSYADEAIAEVIETGEQRVLPPMSPFERAAIHARVAENDAVQSESAGLPPMRRVVISLADPDSER
ncbi:MAG: R3H domain-containing nucleic acid-binding protein [Bifidobacterium sp.]|nr:R3H domain-containing nucleic acid-binding protein [Bifidobacterium sp.]